MNDKMKKEKRNCEIRSKGNGKAGKLAVRPKYRRNGNVARLAKVVRDKINVMIQDGVSYTAIVANLGKKGKGLDISNLSRWKSGGYQDWLAEQAFIARVRARQETPSDLTRN